ncbi:MAG: peptidoglycan editing factor PgeF [Oscillospiraceae bacterium]|jgi:YfiH family protein|nr:peptidoglycan editing factor PgeF [Oscillospiraceae bacterium]
MNLNTKQVTWNQNRGVGFLTFPALERLPFLSHAFSTRLGGVSQQEFSSLNLAFGRGDSDRNVLENYRRICAAVGLKADSMVSSAQVHKTVVRRVGRQNCGEGFTKPQMEGVDGLITNEPGVTLVTHHADCVPLYFADPVRKAVGLSHAGWRGTAAGMGAETVRSMVREFHSRPQDLICVIGPSIGPCCFEVDFPVYEVFAGMKDLSPQDWTREDGGGKYHIDLWQVNRRILMSAGVPDQNIFISGFCTQCHPDLLFSHRASHGKRGGLSAFLALRGNSDAD